MTHLLTVGQVLARYKLRDLRASRRVMEAAGAVQGRRTSLVSEADLEAWETRP